MNNFNILWCIPFASLIMTIAILPGFISHNTWNKYIPIVSISFVLMLLIPFIRYYDIVFVIHSIEHTLLEEYIPFVLLISSLYYIAYGISISSKYITGKPFSNTIFLLFAMLISSIVGTTGSSIIFIGTFLNANKLRLRKVHLVIFFIITVSNIGGSLSPLGDPPLFLGYLAGVDFFWFGKNMFQPFAITSMIILIIFLLVDSYMYSKEKINDDQKSLNSRHILYVQGKFNIIIATLIPIILILSTSGLIDKSYESLFRNISLLSILLLAFWLNNKNKLSIDHTPVMEVAQLFMAIFITSIPCIKILQSGIYSDLYPLSILTDVNNPNIIGYFWISGLLSSVLDNAPTFMIFFNLASSGDIEYFNTYIGNKVLLSISISTVFMGCLTYVGNAPNLIVKSIALSNDIKMPSMAIYFIIVSVIVMPIFYILTAIFLT